MGMLLNPYILGVPPGIYLFGNTGSIDANSFASGNDQCGVAFQASSDAVVKSIVIKGNTGSSSSINYYVCIYAATSETVWSGALLGNSAIQNGLGISEVKSIPLISPVSVTSGNWYALTTLAESNMSVGMTFGGASRFFSDTYSDGPAATAGASGFNVGRTQCVYATT